ncbi:MAG: DUF4157 domain-containing protein [Aureispira sp.]
MRLHGIQKKEKPQPPKRGQNPNTPTIPIPYICKAAKFCVSTKKTKTNATGKNPNTKNLGKTLTTPQYPSPTFVKTQDIASTPTRTERIEKSKKSNTMYEHQQDHTQQQSVNYQTTSQTQSEATPQTEAPTTTSLPKNMKAGFEYSWGISLEDVRVHYNSDLPAQKGDGQSYLDGTDIYLAPEAEEALSPAVATLARAIKNNELPTGDQATSEDEAPDPQPNKTGIPDQLKTNIENMSGYSFDEVRVHYNSKKPAEDGALAYAYGLDVYIGTGQEEHLAHELWHVVQQMEGGVKGNRTREKDAGLESEAEEKAQKVRKGGKNEAKQPKRVKRPVGARQNMEDGDAPAQEKGWKKSPYGDAGIFYKEGYPECFKVTGFQVDDQGKEAEAIGDMMKIKRPKRRILKRNAATMAGEDGEENQEVNGAEFYDAAIAEAYAPKLKMAETKAGRAGDGQAEAVRKLAGLKKEKSDARNWEEIEIQEYITGKNLAELLARKEVTWTGMEKLGREMGKLLVYDLVIRNIDRFAVAALTEHRTEKEVASEAARKEKWMNQGQMEEDFWPEVWTGNKGNIMIVGDAVYSIDTQGSKYEKREKEEAYQAAIREYIRDMLGDAGDAGADTAWQEMLEHMTGGLEGGEGKADRFKEKFKCGIREGQELLEARAETSPYISERIDAIKQNS